MPNNAIGSRIVNSLSPNRKKLPATISNRNIPCISGVCL